MQERITISVDPDVLKTFDEKLGIVRRSAQINKLMSEWVGDQNRD